MRLEIWVLTIAAVLDYLIGDPWHWWHPVQGIGWAISQSSHLALARLKSPLALKLAGVGLGVGIVGGVGVIGWAIARLTTHIHPVVGLGVQSILLASCFAGRSLRDAAIAVLTPLEQGDLPQARSQLGRYVGRDTATLPAAEIRRAVLETVTENATDGVLAPLFYAIAGAFLPGIGSLALALAYKAASTLDSMVGYQTAPYTHLGWFSAKLDDVLTWLPCRLVVFTLGLLSSRPLYVWRLCWRDAPHDPSPNSGWSECVYAATLGVQVGGINYYNGVPKPKPLLGNALHAIASADIFKALQLTRWAFLLWLTGAVLHLSGSGGGG